MILFPRFVAGFLPLPCHDLLKEEKMKFQHVNHGWSFMELLVVLSLLSVIVLGIPVFVRFVVVRHRRHEIMQRMANLLMRTRTQAMGSGRTMALQIKPDQSHPSHYHLEVCRDENNNGIHKPEISSGIDRCWGLAVSIEVPGIMMLTPLPKGFRLPGKQTPVKDSSPVRWGPHKMLICTPWGRCTSGTLVWTLSHQQGYRALRFDGTRGIIQSWASKTGWTWSLLDEQ